MANLKGSRSIPLASKEARNLLSQPGLNIIDHNAGTIEVNHENTAEQVHSLEYGGVNELQSSSRQPQREGELYCQSCHVTLGVREEQLVHYRLDWHRYNLKRRLKGLAPLSQEEFERIAGGDLSSISGSESDSDSNKESEEAKSKLLSMEEEDEEYGNDINHKSKPMGSPFLYFSSEDGRCFAVYKNLVANHKAAEVMNSTTSDLLSSLSSLVQPQVWIILMRAGGHFAGAVFRGSAMVVHKTFHRYTVRAKRGTAQSIRDAHQGGHAPRSAGASLRRYNESALVAEIRELISSWSSHVEEASAIFIRTPKYGRGVFVGDGSNYGKGSAPFSRSDPRLKNIPFVTRRPTVKEVQNVHSKLAAFYEVSSKQVRHAHSPMVLKPKKQPNEAVKEKERELSTVLPDEPKRSNEEGVHSDSGDEVEGEINEVGGAIETTTKKKKKRRAKKTTESQVEVPPPVQRLLKLCRSDANDDGDTLMTELLHEFGLFPINNIAESEVQSSEDKSSVDSCREVIATEAESSTNQKDNSLSILNDVWNGETVLHIAAACGKSSLIPILLLHGANPTIKNKAGHTAYVAAKDKTVRDAFRRFMAQHPTLYDYNAAKVPSPLTEEMERERKEKMAEKKKALKKAKKQREKEHKSEKELEELRLNQAKVLSSLSDREKRALAAEKRMVTQVPTSSTVLRAGACSFCEISLAGVVPFERLQYKYCSMDCLKTHRKQLT